MQIVYTDRHKLHDTTDVLVEGHPLDSLEVPARAEAMVHAIRAEQLGPIVDPTDHGLGPIQAVHDAGYLEFLRTVHAESAAYFGESGPVVTWTFANRHASRTPRSFMGLKGYYAFGWGTPILEGTWEAAYWSAQCALTAAELVRDGEGVAYALCRPPGHHAGPDLYGGYCYLNNAAIAARFLQDMPDSAPQGLDKAKVAILDVDYHHGNGTQIIFYADPSVLYCSLHAHPDEEYPYYWGDVGERGEGAGEGTNCNWPLPRGTDDAQYLAALDDALAIIRDFSPGYLIVSAGFDTMAGDPVGGFCLTGEGLAQVARSIAELGLPTVLIQEGGYHLNELARNAIVFLEAFAPVVRRGTGGERAMNRPQGGGV
jgi:acetoin utilization deacetylase AcuC-like enzyme